MTLLFQDTFAGGALSTLDTHVANSGQSWGSISNNCLIDNDGVGLISAGDNTAKRNYVAAPFALQTGDQLNWTFVAPSTTSNWRLIIGQWDNTGSTSSNRVGLGIFFSAAGGTEIRYYSGTSTTTFTVLATIPGSPSALAGTVNIQVVGGVATVNGTNYAFTELNGPLFVEMVSPSVGSGPNVSTLTVNGTRGAGATVLTPSGFKPITFGTPTMYWAPTRLYPSSLRPVKFGLPFYPYLLTLQVAPVRPVKFGQLPNTLRFAKQVSHLLLRNMGLRTIKFGKPTIH